MAGRLTLKMTQVALSSKIAGSPELYADQTSGSSSIDGHLHGRDWDMCVYCWQEMETTGHEPEVCERKCLHCNRFLIRVGKGDMWNDLCRFCDARREQAEFTVRQREKRHPQAKFDTNDADDEDMEYSPYLIHT